MIKKKEIEVLREHLIRAQNPLFYFDNDQDGLCSYLLLRRFYKKGNGVPVKTSPLGKEYLRRIDEFNPDYIFVLDQPTVSEEFFEDVHKRNLPLVWIDHHEGTQEKIPEWVEYFNPVLSSKKNEPVTKVCYEITKRKDDVWILIAGCIADKFLPKEYKTFLKLYPDLGVESNDPFKVYYSSGIGQISRMFGTGLKDRTTLVMKMIRFLINTKNPYEVLEEKNETLSFHYRFNVINSKLDDLIEKAKKKSGSENIIFFKYAGDTSMSADVANKLSYLYPKKIIVVAYLKGSRINLSLRGKDVKALVGRATAGMKFVTFGGHNDAIGAQMDETQLDEFEKNLTSLVNQKD